MTVTKQTPLSVAGLAALISLGGCAAPEGPSAAPGASLYRCEQGIVFSVRFAGDEAVIDAGSPHGRERLGRDAGGATPAQTVWTSPRMRAEFGLGAAGDEAVLRLPLVPLVARCVRAG